MNKITIEFLSFKGCPLAPLALIQLVQAIDQLHDRTTILLKQVDLLHPTTLDSMKRWGSPTILLNGREVSGDEPGDANNCRIYSGPGGVLSKQDIVAALNKEAGT